MFKRIILAVGIAIGALYVGLGTTSLVLAHQQQAPKEKLIHQKSFGEWEYRALQTVYETAGSTQEGNVKPEVVISIESSLRGKPNLAKLLAKQKGAKDRLFQRQRQIPAVIIPKGPLAPNLLTNFVKKHDIAVKSYTIVAKAANGEVITIFGSPEGEEVFPEKNLQTMIRGVEGNTHTTLQIQGVVAINAQVTRPSSTSLENDSSVLGLDLTPALAIEDLVQEKQIDSSIIQVIPAPLYWVNLEEN